MTDRSSGGRALTGNPAVFLLAVVAVVGVALGGMAMAQNGPPSAEDVLGDAKERYASAETIVGSATVTVANDSANRTVEVSFAVADDNRSRVSVTARNRTLLVGSNGTVGWVHDERTGLTRTYDVPAYNRTTNATEWAASHRWNESAMRALLRDWTPENTTAERAGTERVDGTEAHVVRIEPVDVGRNGTLTLWIHTEEATLLKAELARDERTATVTYENVRFNVSVADSTFQPPGIAPPGGATVVDSFGALTERTRFDLPELNADEYEFETGSTVVYGNATAAIQGYAGPVNVTLVTTTENGRAVMGGALPERGDAVRIGGVNATVAETERGVVVSWRAGGPRHALLSDGSRETTIALAESVIDDDR